MPNEPPTGGQQQRRERVARLRQAVSDISGPWSEELGGLVIELILRLAPESTANHSRGPYHEVCAQAARCLPLRLRDHFEARRATIAAEPDSDVAALAATLAFRSDMHKEFS